MCSKFFAADHLDFDMLTEKFLLYKRTHVSEWFVKAELQAYQPSTYTAPRNEDWVVLNTQVNRGVILTSGSRKIPTSSADISCGLLHVSP